MSTISVVLGIVSVLLALPSPLMGLLIGATAMWTSSEGKHKEEHKSLACAGQVLGIAGAGLSVICLILLFMALALNG